MSARFPRRSMRLARILGIVLIALATGCASTQRAIQPEAPQPDTPRKALEPASPPTPKAEKTTVAATPAPTPPVAPPAGVETRPVAPVERIETPVVTPEVSTERTGTPVVSAEAPAPKPAARVPVVPAPKKEVVAPPAPKPAPLDLTLLEKRLKETNAIGVFTKLTLKNQVDDLINQFRAYYQGRTKTTLAALRQPYDQLVLKVLALLQDSDPPLARAIAESRESIWGILSDPEKFKNL